MTGKVICSKIQQIDDISNLITKGGDDDMILDSAVVRGEMMRQEIGVNELGRKAGIEPRAISRYSRFDSRVFAPTAGKLAKALGIEPEQLLKRDKPRDK